MTGRDYLLLAAIALGCFFALRYILRQRKSGRGCCGSCAGCARQCEHRGDGKKED